MSKVEKVSVALTSDMLATLRAAVASGDYASTSEVVREALREWRGARIEQQQMSEIRKLVAEGDASGYSAYEGLESIKKRGRDRLSKQK